MANYAGVKLFLCLADGFAISAQTNVVCNALRRCRDSDYAWPHPSRHGIILHSFERMPLFFWMYTISFDSSEITWLAGLFLVAAAKVQKGT